jgi:hypothetical protein
MGGRRANLSHKETTESAMKQHDLGYRSQLILMWRQQMQGQ